MDHARAGEAAEPIVLMRLVERIGLSIVVLAVVAGSLACGGRLVRDAREGRRMFADGHCEDALRKFDPVIEAGAADGRVLFEAHSCEMETGGDPDRIKMLQDQAIEKLLADVQSGAGEVVDYHYLAALQYGAGLAVEGGATGLEAIRKFTHLQELVEGTRPAAAAAGDPGEAGGEPDDAGAEGPPPAAADFFHFAELYELMHRQDLSMKYYQRAAAEFDDQPSPPAAWLARSLAGAAPADLASRDFETAAARIDRARELIPDIEIDPMVEGMAMMGANRFEEAEAAWNRVLAPAGLVLECQLRAALAMKAEKFGRLPKKGPTGLPLDQYTDEQIETFILELADELEDFRKTFIPGWRVKTDSPAKQMSETERNARLGAMRRTEKKFLALHLEYLLRGHPLHPFANSHGYVDLLRF